MEVVPPRDNAHGLAGGIESSCKVLGLMLEFRCLQGALGDHDGRGDPAEWRCGLMAASFASVKAVKLLCQEGRTGLRSYMPLMSSPPFKASAGSPNSVQSVVSHGRQVPA